ncbi:MAG: mycofactocin biosynthesis chaperone MftB [Proteobacteria bacterium]|nr:mycofactocin biosynthesis chaperone MftB [Pseudomonadota bacterium]
MVPIETKRYKLAPGTQVREEDFGLLFYTMSGPRLYFLSSGELLDDRFFEGNTTLQQVLDNDADDNEGSTNRISSLGRSLDRLKETGVILEC